MKGITKLIVATFCMLPAAAFGNETPKKPIFYESQPFKALVPNEQRDEKFARLLGVSLKIHVNGASGSGTICHYDESSGFAHVISCGHLWSGNMDYDPKSKDRPTARVITWYKNSIKLDDPETFDAEVLFWSNDRGYDVSLLRFKPDWSPGFAPIDESFVLKKGLALNSMGCDGGTEVARYEVVFDEMRNPDIITQKNSPRPGRSGGGLITDSVKVVGVCWGTSDISSGNGIGYFTPTSSIKKVFERNNHGWLLKLLKFRLIPIMDHDSGESIQDKSFIPFPRTS